MADRPLLKGAIHHLGELSSIDERRDLPPPESRAPVCPDAALFFFGSGG
jgi:hypothetical protein